MAKSKTKPKKAPRKKLKKPSFKLTNQQKEYFHNLRQKMGDTYPLIENDINRI